MRLIRRIIRTFFPSLMVGVTLIASGISFAQKTAKKDPVSVRLPGAAFGDDRTVRLSYATSIDIIKKGLDRFQDFCRTL